MNLVPGVVTQNLGKITLLAQKSSPELLLVGGVVGMVGSTVLACRATLKMDEVLTEANKTLEQARTLENENYSERDRTRDVALIKYKTGAKIVRLYAPAVIIGGVSIYAIATSHTIMSRRNAGLTAAYAALDRGFREYRARVVEKYGEEEDQEFRYGSQQIEIDDPDKPGKKKTVTRVGPDAASIYAKFFDPTCSPWQPDAEFNKIFLRNQQNHANDLLHARGHVFLNEVYDSLGIDRTKAGAIVGWVLSGDGETDNYVDFGIFNGESARVREFVHGREDSILLDFNVDGVIFDKI